MKRAGLIVKILVFALIAFLSWKILDLRGDISQAQAQRDEMRTQLAALEVENDEMQRRIDAKEDDATIEEIARETLGLRMPGEQVYYD